MTDFEHLPPRPRLTRDEVCALAGYGPQTLARRIAAGRMPKAVDRGRQALFDRRQIYEALGVGQTTKPMEEADGGEWTFDPVAFREHRTRQIREAAAARRRPREVVETRRRAALTGRELGKYVTLRPRADGTHRVFFQVPERLRPSDWPSLIPLPRAEPRTGNLDDEHEVARIRADAAALFGDLAAARNARVR